jgi:hypothetical protein
MATRNKQIKVYEVEVRTNSSYTCRVEATNKEEAEDAVRHIPHTPDPDSFKTISVGVTLAEDSRNLDIDITYAEIVAHRKQTQKTTLPNTKNNTLAPDYYEFEVSSLPEVIKGTLVKVTFTAYLDIKDDGEKQGSYTEWFDIQQPRKLLRFLEAIGEPYSEDEKFQITPSRWFHKTCLVKLHLKTWIDQDDQSHGMKLLEFLDKDFWDND